MTDNMKWIEEIIPSTDKNWVENHNKLCKLIKENIPNPKYGAEIGVAFGSNSFNLLSNFNSLTLYSIDPYIKYSVEDKMSDLVENEKGDQVYEFVFNKLKNNFGERSVFIRGTSDNIYALGDDFFDFIYIDGDHSYESVKKDLENAFSKIKKNGILAGDDYGLYEELNFNVRKAVDEFCLKNNLKLNLDGLLWWIFK